MTVEIAAAFNGVLFKFLVSLLTYPIEGFFTSEFCFLHRKRGIMLNQETGIASIRIPCETVLILQCLV